MPASGLNRDWSGIWGAADAEPYDVEISRNIRSKLGDASVPFGRYAPAYPAIVGRPLLSRELFSARYIEFC